jgi:hypothetical protein
MSDRRLVGVDLRTRRAGDHIRLAAPVSGFSPNCGNRTISVNDT